MYLPAKVEKKDISIELFCINQYLGKKFAKEFNILSCINESNKNKNKPSIIINKQINTKNNRTNSIINSDLDKDNILNWFFSFSLEQRKSLLSINNPWFSKLLLKLYNIYKNKTNITFNFTKDDNSIFHLQNNNNNCVKFLGGNKIFYNNYSTFENIEAYSLPPYYNIFNCNTNNFCSQIYSYNLSKKLSEKKLINDISILKYNDLDIVSLNNVLKDKHIFKEYVDSISQNKFLTKIIDCNYNLNTKIYSFSFPFWFNNNFSLGEFILASIEQIIQIKYILHSVYNNLFCNKTLSFISSEKALSDFFVCNGLKEYENKKLNLIKVIEKEISNKDSNISNSVCKNYNKIFIEKKRMLFEKEISIKNIVEFLEKNKNNFDKNCSSAYYYNKSNIDSNSLDDYDIEKCLINTYNPIENDDNDYIYNKSNLCVYEFEERYSQLFSCLEFNNFFDFITYTTLFDYNTCKQNFCYKLFQKFDEVCAAKSINDIINDIQYNNNDNNISTLKKKKKKNKKVKLKNVNICINNVDLNSKNICENNKADLSKKDKIIKEVVEDKKTISSTSLSNKYKFSFINKRKKNNVNKSCDSNNTNNEIDKENLKKEKNSTFIFNDINKNKFIKKKFFGNIMKVKLNENNTISHIDKDFNNIEINNNSNISKIFVTYNQIKEHLSNCNKKTNIPRSKSFEISNNSFKNNEDLRQTINNFYIVKNNNKNYNFEVKDDKNNTFNKCNETFINNNCNYANDCLLNQRYQKYECKNNNINYNSHKNILLNNDNNSFIFNNLNTNNLNINPNFNKNYIKNTNSLTNNQNSNIDNKYNSNNFNKYNDNRNNLFTLNNNYYVPNFNLYPNFYSNYAYYSSSLIYKPTKNNIHSNSYNNFNYINYNENTQINNFNRIHNNFFYNQLQSDIIKNSNLSLQLVNYLKDIKYIIIDKIKTILKFIYPHSTIDIYGSFKVNLSIESSDVDLAVCLNSDKNLIESINEITKVFINEKLYHNNENQSKNFNLFSKINPIAKASVPIIKLECKTEDIINYIKLFNEKQLFYKKETNKLYNKCIDDYNQLKDFINNNNNILQNNFSILNFDDLLLLKFDLTFIEKNSNLQKLEYVKKSVNWIETMKLEYINITPLILIIKRLLQSKNLNTYYNGMTYL